MDWTNKEQELISVLDHFLADCAQSEKLKGENYHLLLERILIETKGDVVATKKYCQKILDQGELALQDNSQENHRDEYSPLSIANAPAIGSEEPLNPHQEVDFVYPGALASPKFKSYWTILFITLTAATVFFVAKKSPHLTPTNNVAERLAMCPSTLIEKAQLGIKNRRKSFLKQAIADFQQFKSKQPAQAKIDCEEIIWEAQFIYAIDFLASTGQRKEATRNLCNISPEYYQSKEVIPWFSRWSNTNQDFRLWLVEYKSQDNCVIASYLE